MRLNPVALVLLSAVIAALGYYGLPIILRVLDVPEPRQIFRIFFSLCLPVFVLFLACVLLSRKETVETKQSK